ncbi:hypothetical protein EZV62_008124 [Acer yangbiense]|uniref:HMA domain-containing protein n=1 Tax=Acer yangbiense TaxID=1000413 RepID=A0A5C7ID89_9ROSI|nr:hypothetical protein EZV62_008124 [Acer yangbiense]
MAKTLSTVAALIAIAALCFSTLVGVAQATERKLVVDEQKLVVEGKVYCDTCRVKFETTLSEVVEGAGVKLICRDRVSEETKLEMEAETDKSGHYRFEVEGDHAEEICEVHLVKSPREDCNEIVKGWNSARILLTTDVGVVDTIRQANALGFMKKQALENCAKVLQGLGFLPIN